MLDVDVYAFEWKSKGFGDEWSNDKDRCPAKIASFGPSGNGLMVFMTSEFMLVVDAVFKSNLSFSCFLTVF